MEPSSDTRHEIKTLLRLVAPEAVEVELVPLAAVEKAEFLFFWATIFLTVWGTVLGTWLSLLVVEYNNKPVIYILIAVLVFLTFLVVSFSIAGFRARSSARKRARGTMPATIKVPFPERMDRLIKRLLSLLPEEFTETQFKALVSKFDDWAAADSVDTDLSFSSLLELYRTDVAERRVPARRVVEALDVVEHV